MIKGADRSPRHDLIRISELVMQIYEELRRGSKDTDSFANMITPYRLVASAAQSIKGDAKQDSPGAAMRREESRPSIKALEGRVSELHRYHRAARVIGLIESARLRKVLQDEVEQLKVLLNIEEIAIVLGNELLDYKNLNLEVVDCEGDGIKSVISEIVEPGYRNRVNGVVIKQPRVRVRFED